MSRYLVAILCAAPLLAQDPARSVVEGTVVNSVTGAPLQGARLRIRLMDQDPLYTKADAAGHFQFSSLASARYMLDVNLPGYRQTVAGSVFVDTLTATDPEGRSASPVSKSIDGDGTLHASVNIPLTPTAVIAGSVSDPNGLPFFDTTIDVLQQRPVGSRTGGSYGTMLSPDGKTEIAVVARVRPNDRGEFRIGNLLPGSYYLVAQKMGGAGTWDLNYRPTYYPASLDLANAKAIEVEAGRQVRADLRILRQGGASITGRLSGLPAATGTAPQFYTNITLAPEQNVPVPMTPRYVSTTNGDFEIKDILPGNYRLNAETRHLGSVFGGVQRAMLGATQILQPGERGLQDIEIKLLPMNDIAGEIVYPAGCRAPANLMVVAVGAPLSPSRVQTTATPDGKFVLTGLPPGNFKIEVYPVPPAIAGHPASILLADREILNGSFDYPFPGSASLRIQMPCGQGGAQ